MRALAATIALVAIITTASAQTVDSLGRAPAIGDTIVADIVAVGRDAIALVRLDGYDWIVAGSVLGTAAALSPIDDDVRSFALRNRSGGGGDAARAGNIYGTWWPAIGISGGLYLTGLALDEPSVRVAGRHVAQAVLYAGLVTTTAKLALGRQRPHYDEGQYVFAPFTLDDRFFSIPSGHATMAFAISSSLAADIDHPAATVALYGLATLTALSRVYDDRHWTSDILLGAAVGTACGYGVANLDDHAEGSSLLLLPATNGLTLVWTFR